MRKSMLLLGDIIVLYVALFLALLIRYGGDYGRQIDKHFVPFSIIFVIWIVIFYISNLYELGVVKNNLPFFTTYAYVMLVNIGIAIAFFYLMPFFAIAPKTNLFIFVGIALALELGWRSLYNKLLVQSGYRNNTLLIGLSDQARELYDFLLVNPQLGYNALGILDIKDQTAQDLLEKIITQKNVKTLVLSPEVYEIPHIIDMLYRLLGQRIGFYELSRFSERVTGKIPLRAISQTWFLANLSENEKRLYEFGKRVFDILIVILFGILTLPFYPLLAIAIRLDSKGPIFYLQKRVGRGGKLFTIAKFRNMIAEAEAESGPVWASEDDARTTRVGILLRKSRLDEIPQLWNIFKGEMSFVGPRPERPEFYERLKREIPFYEERNLIAPGLTGWAQIKYKLDFRGGMTIRDALEKVQYDLYYIKNRSLLLDIGIILKTINIVLLKVFWR